MRCLIIHTNVFCNEPFFYIFSIQNGHKFATRTQLIILSNVVFFSVDEYLLDCLDYFSIIIDALIFFVIIFKVKSQSNLAWVIILHLLR